MFPSRARSLFQNYTRTNIVRFVTTVAQANPKTSTKIQTDAAKRPVILEPNEIFKSQIAKASIAKNEGKLIKSLDDLKDFPGSLNPSIYLDLINGWKKLEKEDKMEQVLEVAISKQISLSEEFFIPFFYVYGQKNKFDNINSLLERMKQLQVMPKSLTMNALSSVYAHSGDFGTAGKIIEEMKNNGIKVDSRAYRGRLKYYLSRYDRKYHAENVKGALETIQMMKDEKIEITEGEYVVLFRILEEFKADADVILNTYNSLLEGVRRNPKITSVAISAYGKKGNKDKIIELVKNYPKPIPSYIAASVLSSLRTTDQRDLIRECFDQVIKSGYDFNELMIVGSVRYLEKQQLAGILENVMKRNRGFSPNALAIYLNQCRIKQDYVTIFRTFEYQLNKLKRQLSVGAIRLGLTLSSFRREMKLWLGEQGSKILDEIRKDLSKKDNSEIASKELEDKIRALLKSVDARDKSFEEFQSKLAQAN